MAVMIPDETKEFDPASKEGEMFAALSGLPDDYYVFHSFDNVTVQDHAFDECQTDFVVLNQMKGCIFIEAKAGQVQYRDRKWFYGNGKEMKHDGPYRQGDNNKNNFLVKLPSRIKRHCKFLHAVWFPDLQEDALKRQQLPQEADPAITLTSTERDPEKLLKKLNEIYQIEIPKAYIRGHLNDKQFDELIKTYLNPCFEVIPETHEDIQGKHIIYRRLLEQQKERLDEWRDQPYSTVEGAAGTGKTMVAVEQARRFGVDGQEVLFLCYNNKLKVFLQNNYDYKNVSYYTIDGFACSQCRTAKPDYDQLKTLLEEDRRAPGKFPYQHVIIDEGQDFAQREIEDNQILTLLYDIIKEKEKGTFYFFYDELQMIQAWAMPAIIDKLAGHSRLSRNCRNTRNIAKTALSPLTSEEPKMISGAMQGASTEIFFCTDGQDVKDQIKHYIDQLVSQGFHDIVLLSCKTMESSILKDFAGKEKYDDKFLFTTCRKYKGLEADAIILLDVDRDTFLNDHGLIYYVGASRARLRLGIFTTLTDDDCREILYQVFEYMEDTQDPKREIAQKLKSNISENFNG